MNGSTGIDVKNGLSNSVPQGSTSRNEVAGRFLSELS